MTIEEELDAVVEGAAAGGVVRGRATGGGGSDVTSNGERDGGSMTGVGTDDSMGDEEVEVSKGTGGVMLRSMGTMSQVEGHGEGLLEGDEPAQLLFATEYPRL